jgi:fibronectin-binding autotransporter adhesin
VNADTLELADGVTVDGITTYIACNAVLEFNWTNVWYHNAVTFTGGGTVRLVGGGEILFGYPGYPPPYNGLVNWNMSAGSLIDVESGTFKTGDAGLDSWTGSLTNVYVASGAQFNGAESNVIINNLTGSGSFYGSYNNYGYLDDTIGSNNGSGTFSGPVSDNYHAMNLVKIGTGTQQLTGTLSYTGTTTISAGTLDIDGSCTTSSVSVASGATLGGTGSISGAVTVGSGGTIAPGDASPGTMTISAAGTALDLSAGSTTCALALGTSGDLIACTGASSVVKLGGTLAITNAGGLVVGT